MKIFHITDEDGREYSVEEAETTIPEQKDEDTSTLTSDEIAALKKLAGSADRLLQLLEVKDSDSDEENIEDEDKDLEEKIAEEVVDTDEDKLEKNGTRDSIKSIGAIEKRKVANDSIDIQDDIASAWSKRYNGGKE